MDRSYWNSQSPLTRLPAELVLIIADFCRPCTPKLYLLAYTCKRFWGIIAPRISQELPPLTADFAGWATFDGHAVPLKMWLEIAPRPPPEALNKYRRAYSQRNQEIEKGGEANTVNVFSHSIAECPDVRVSSFMLDHAFDFAVEQNKLSMVEVMLTTGKDLLRDINLIRFVKTQSMFKLLLAHGAEVCSNPAPLIHSVRNRDFEFTSLLLSSGYRPDMQLYSATETAVYWAARDDDADMLKKLAEYDGFEAAVTTWLGHEIDDECMCRYCLHELPITPVSAAAVLSRTTDCLEFLLDHKYVEPSKGHVARRVFHRLGLRTPKEEMLAKQREHCFSVMKLLLDYGLDPDMSLGERVRPFPGHIEAATGLTLLCAAAKEGKNELVRLLLSKGAKLEGPPGEETPLELALKHGRLTAAKCLIKAHTQRGVSIPATLLNYEPSFSSIPFLKLLVDTIRQEAIRQEAIRQEAIRQRTDRRRATRRQATRRGPVINCDSIYGEYHARYRDEYIHTVMNSEPVVLNPSWRGEYASDTPLMVAVKLQKLAMVKFLLYNGADVNHGNHKGETPIMIAASQLRPDEQSTKDMCRLLLFCGADPNFCDNRGHNSISYLGVVQPYINPDCVPHRSAFFKLRKTDCQWKEMLGTACVRDPPWCRYHFCPWHSAWKHRQANGFEPYENDGSDHNVPCNMASNNLASDNNDSDNNDSDNNDSDNNDSDNNDSDNNDSDNNDSDNDDSDSND